ncbi:MAG TPA: hypothetical protein VNB90_11125 [Cytophagaceae bacterium]|nr:hypothetical protein [Cytophagaceae bacterium]
MKFIILYLYDINAQHVKRIAIISALAIYLVLNLGISVKLHYCGDSISYVEFFSVEKKNCCKNPKANCCKDKIAYINPETNQVDAPVVHFSFPDYAKYALIPHDLSFLSVSVQKLTKSSRPAFSQEIFYRKIPLYLFHKVIIV